MLKNNEDVLNIVYNITNHLQYEVDKDNIVTILEKQDHKIQRFFRKIRFKIPEYKKITLDEYGSFVFLQIDGKRNVKDIGERLEVRFGNEIQPLYERLLVYLNHIDVNCNYIEKSNFS
ncbi:PqqD family protein [Clostridium sp. SHJSY1]|uniref:PqqD family protein n=1 Tax=Clostridium sp. SHJSY1 TaxID=2942483 RepID=UPI002876C9E3|nr:PqqD family protein [Clostridium sp. SHJSY1]MDS0527080.1 PqqD family protein [Clostridium sp. SHJSY1]